MSATTWAFLAVLCLCAIPPLVLALAWAVEDVMRALAGDAE